MSSRMSSQLVRKATLAATALVLGVGLYGCGSSDDEKAIEALCTDWEWNPNLDDEANSASLSATMNRYDYEQIPDRIIREARMKCGHEHFAEYDAYAAEIHDEYLEATGDEAEVPGPDPATETDTSIADALAARGVTDDDVRRLGGMAGVTGYGLGKNTPLPFEQAQSFAFVLLMTCDSVAEGSLTWAESIADDVGTGAPLADARAMNEYLRDTYCPSLD